MEPLSPSDPRQIGPYEVKMLLGRGGMGVVYLCSAQDGSLVAVKVMTIADGIINNELKRRFEQEIRATMRVGGKHTARVLNYNVTDRPYWYASEHIIGPNLGEIMQSEHLTVQEILNYTWNICIALRDAHRAGVIHRDVKPGNIIVGSNSIKLVDFGIANIADLTRITSTGARGIGTPAFMAPEYINEGKLTTAYDIFSLGVTIANMAMCAPFGNHRNPQTMLHAICYNQPDLSIMPTALRPIVEACLRKDPAQRATLDQIAEMLPPSVLVAGSSTNWLSPTVRATIVDHAARVRWQLRPPKTRAEPRFAPARVKPSFVRPITAPRQPAARQRPPKATRPPRRSSFGRRVMRAFKRILITTMLVGICVGLWRITPINDIKDAISTIVGESTTTSFEDTAESLVERIETPYFKEDISGQATDLFGRTVTVNSAYSAAFGLKLNITVKGKSGDSSDDLEAVASQSCIILIYSDSNNILWDLDFYGSYSPESSTGRSTTGDLYIQNVLLLPGELELRTSDCKSSSTSSVPAAAIGTNSIDSYSGFIVGSSTVMPVPAIWRDGNRTYVVTPVIDEVWTYMRIDGTVSAPIQETTVKALEHFTVQSFEVGTDENLICTYNGSTEPITPMCNSLTLLQA